MNVLIMGASRGIGLELVKCYQANKARVFATCRNLTEELQDTKATIFSNIDVTRDESASSLSNQLKLMNEPLDLVVHNAGVLIGDSLENVKFNDLRLQFEINSIAPLRMIKAVLPFMDHHGKIGIVSSMMGSISDNQSGSYYGYRMSKAATNQMAKTLAVDLKKDQKTSEIIVTIIHPGYVKTEMTGYQGLIEPSVSAQGIFEMLKNNKVTGAYLHVNGEKIPW